MKPSISIGFASSPEMDLLCACVRPGEAEKAAAEILRERCIDWPGFIALAKNHHVVPLVYDRLKGGAAKGVGIPPAWLAQLRALSRSIAAYDLRATAQLCRLQARLAGQGIPVIPIKGPALAALAYGDVALRQFEDLDLIVRREHLLRAVECLEEDGYRLRELSARVCRTRFLATLQSWSLCKPNHPPLDLKPVLISHALCDESSADFMASACRRVPIAETKSLDAPGPEAMLLAVCLDGAGEMWFKLSSVADAGALLARYPDQDWRGFLGEAVRRGQRRTLLVGACLAEALLGIRVPEAFREAECQDPAARRLARQAAERLCRLAPRHSFIARQSWFAFQTRERASDRLRFVLRLLFVPGPFELQVLPLPGFLYFLHSLVRPFRLAWDVAGRGGRHRQLTLPPPDEKVRSEARST